MRTLLSGPIATLLVFAPLIAVPLVAVFGMPQFTSTSATSQADKLKFGPDNPPSSSDPSSSAPSSSASSGAELGGTVQFSETTADAQPAANGAPSAPAASDPFAEFSRSRDDRTAQDGRPSSNPAHAANPGRQRWPNEENGLAQKSLLAFDESHAPRTVAAIVERGASDETPIADPAERSKSKAATELTGRRASGNESALRLTDSHPAAVPSPPSGDEQKDPREKPSSWQDAVSRLNVLGIRDFQLLPGDHEGEFLFSCRFASRTNPRVMHVFEAEAPEPLAAVAKVLQQIDEWRDRQRTRANARAMSREPGTKSVAGTPSGVAVSVSAVEAFDR